MTEVISVRFRGGCKTYYFDPGQLTVSAGQHVIVETASGHEYAQCSEGNHQVPEQSVVKPLRPVVRIATDNDRRTDQLNRERERDAFAICEKKIAAHKLEMKLIRVESNFDGSKIIFFFTAEGRVDFRELVKDLATVFRSRIELRQVGVRDEAKMIGGLGICGRPLCCSQFMDEFAPVSIKMAKTQNLSLNPTKISGTCGRLMCCLKYEQNAYEDAVKRMPKVESFVQTPDGPGNVKSVDLLQETMKVSLDSAPESLKCYHNCEVRVLRNGKGSREGIEIPLERPTRYVEERPEEESGFAEPLFSTPFYMSSALEEAPVREKIGGPESGGKSRRRHRGGRRRNKGPAQEQAKEQAKEQPREKPAAKSEPKAPGKPERKAEPAAAEGEAKRRRPRHRGGRRRNKGGGEGAKSE